jgi:hypothetical protein
MSISNNDLYCKLCDYSARCISDWYIHISSKKHERDGKKVSTECIICNITFSNHWLVKKHYLNHHATKEERSKQKYYCSVCDIVFFAKLYHDNHFKGIRHKNRINIEESIKKVNDRVEFLEKNKEINKENENII